MSRWTRTRAGRLTAVLAVGAIAAGTVVLGGDVTNRRERAVAAVDSTPGLSVGLHQDLTWDGHAWRRAQAIDLARGIHAEVSRSSLLWHLVEPTQGTRDWSRVDAVVDELAASGMEIVFSAYGSPSWANGVPASTPEAWAYVPTGAAFGTWKDRYVDFVRDAARRYRGRGIKWEVWNEQNEHWFWKPAPNLDQYVELFTAARAAILAEDPTAKVAVGGLAGIFASGPTDINGLTFLRGMVERGVAFEHVAIHPYDFGGTRDPAVDQQWDNNFTDIARVHDLLESLGRRDVPLWVTEWGWSTGEVDASTQATYVRRSLEMLRSYPYVTIATYFVDYDRPTYGHGLFDTEFRPKPAAAEFAAFAAPLPGGTAPTTTSPPPTTTTAPPTTTTGAPPVTSPPPTTTTAAPTTTTARPATPTTAAPTTTTAKPAPRRRWRAFTVTRRGSIRTSGSSAVYGGLDALTLNLPVVGAATSADGEGYWLVASDGGVFAFGEAAFHGSTGAVSLNQPVVGMTSTGPGAGYWLVAADGGIFAFGDAAFHGSTGHLTLNQPVVGMAATPSGNGYWLVAADGGIFAFGDAAFHGSTGAVALNQPIVGMAPTPTGGGYWLVARDGGVFAFGDATFHGSGVGAGGTFVGILPDPDGSGYALVTTDGRVDDFASSFGPGSGERDVVGAFLL